MPFIPRLKPGERQFIRLRKVEFQEKEFTDQSGNAFTTYWYRVEYYGDDSRMQKQIPVPADEKYRDWTLSANGTVHRLIQSANPGQGDAFYLRRPTDPTGKYRVWRLGENEWEEVTEEAEASPPPPAERTYAPLDEDTPPPEESPEPQQAQQQKYRASQCRGALVVAYIASSVAAGTSHETLRKIRFTEEQVTSLMIAAGTVHGGKFGDGWRSVDPVLIRKEIEVNTKIIERNGVHPLLKRKHPKREESESEQEPEPEPSPPSQEMLDDWAEQGLKPGDKDEAGNIVVSPEGLPF